MGVKDQKMFLCFCYLKFAKIYTYHKKAGKINFGIIKMAGQAHLLRNHSAGELKLSTSQKTLKRLLLELESFPENGLYLFESVRICRI